MLATYNKSIYGVMSARDKLKKVMLKKYPLTKGSRYEIGIDPSNGKYTIVVFLSDPDGFKRMPSSVDGYAIINGFKPISFDEGIKDVS